MALDACSGEPSLFRLWIFLQKEQFLGLDQFQLLLIKLARSIGELDEHALAGVGARIQVYGPEIGLAAAIVPLPSSGLIPDLRMGRRRVAVPNEQPPG